MSKLLPNGTDICQCTVCDKIFNSTYAFDYHRIGLYKDNERRCLSTGEMIERGMAKTKLGRWISQKYTPDADVNENQETSL